MPSFPESFPVLQTERLVLRKIVPNDQAAVFAGLSHPQVIQYYGVAYRTYRDTKLQMNWYDDLLKQKTGIWWAMCTTENPDLIGVCGFYNLQAQHRKAELGYWLLPDYWQKGLMHEALSCIVPFGLNNLHFHRIEAYVETENKASQHLLQKLNFQLEGTMQDCEFKKGRFISLFVFALLS